MFEEYGGGDWPSAVLPNAFNDTCRFGGFGYGKVIVDEAGIVRSVNDFGFQDALDRMFTFGEIPVSSRIESDAMGGYWYRGKSWRRYKDSDYTAKNIDQVVEQEMAAFNKSNVVINDEKLKLQSVELKAHRSGPLLTVRFNDGEELRALFWQGGFKTSQSTARAKCVRRFKLESGKMESQVVAVGDLDVTYTTDGQFVLSGMLPMQEDESKALSIESRFNESALRIGSSELKVDGEQVILSGTLGTITYRQIKELVDEHPEVKTIAFSDIIESNNPEVNWHAGRLIRKAGLNTKVLSEHVVASGGLDLFCAGSKRTIGPGGVLRVRSWSDGTFDGSEYPADHPAHHARVEYYKSMLGEQAGNDFYLHSLTVPSEKVCRVSDAELKQWNLVTD